MQITIKNGENPSVSDVLTLLADNLSHENGEVWSPSDEQAELLKKVFDGWDGVPVNDLAGSQDWTADIAGLLERMTSWAGWERHGRSTIKTVHLGPDSGYFSLRVDLESRNVERLWADPDGNTVDVSRYDAGMWDAIVGLINEAELHRGNVVSSTRIGQ